MRATRSCLLLAVLVFTSGAQGAGQFGADTFLPAGVKSGSIFTRALCEFVGFSVWVELEGQGECIRYFAGGVSSENEIAIVYFHGDQIAHFGAGPSGALISRSYSGSSAASLQAQAEAESRRLGLPYIWLSRPGVYGSSGDHHQRRLPRESLLVDAALSKIKSRHRIRAFALAGFSGGGHVVAALLPRRTDVRCAVLASGVLSVKKRARMMGWADDITGFESYDPLEHIEEVTESPQRRLFVLASVEDRRVPYATQVDYFHALRAAGHQATLLHVKGSGEEAHVIGPELLQTAALCVAGESDYRIKQKLGSY